MSRRGNCNFETKEAFSQTKWLFSCLISDYESFTVSRENTWMMAAFRGMDILPPVFYKEMQYTFKLNGAIKGIFTTARVGLCEVGSNFRSFDSFSLIFNKFRVGRTLLRLDILRSPNRGIYLARGKTLGHWVCLIDFCPSGLISKYILRHPFKCLNSRKLDCVR